MTRWLCCIGLAAVAIFTGAACGDDSSSTGGGGTGGAGGSGGSGGMGGSDGGGVCDPTTSKTTTEVCVTINDCDKATYEGTTAPEYLCDANKSKDPNAANACRNDSDCPIINTGKVRDIVRVIALSCRDREPKPGVPEAERIAACKAEADCNTAEVKKETARQIMEPGISDACGQCYTGVALCSIAFCLAECAANADDINCVKCQFKAGCRSIYERCSGLERK